MKRIFLIGFLSVALAIGLWVYQLGKYSDGLLHVVFCDVGQGDAVLIRGPSGKTILFDAGPGDKVLSCLNDHMPFWDRVLSLVIVSHPHADHFLGLFSVVDRYKIMQFGREELENTTAEYKAIEQITSEKGIPKRFLFQGDSYRMPDGVALRILGPRKAFLAATSPGGKIGETSEFASLIVHLSYGTLDVLFTGDAQSQQVADDTFSLQGNKIDVLQVPHHGSRTGLTQEIVQRLSPEMAVISVGKNRYGHPATETLQLLTEGGVTVFRTDKTGAVEIVSDGQKWWVKKD